MLCMETAIPTPDGWTTFGRLEVGDSLFDEQGVVCQVIAVHPVDDSPISYRLTFDDGFQIDACAAHKWLTYNNRELAALTRIDPDWRERRRKTRPSRAGTTKSEKFRASLTARNSARTYAYKDVPSGSVRTTEEIAATLQTASGRANHAIPVTKPLHGQDVYLPIDPYVLGAWLGDGNSRHAFITCFDPDILGQIELAGFAISPHTRIGNYGINGGLKTLLAEVGLLGNKHIPEVYLRASLSQRIALFQGLMDTDGGVVGKGSCEFTTTKPKLQAGFQELLATFGIKSEGQTGRATLYGKDCGEKYRFKFVTSIPAFRLQRKLDKQNLSPRRTTTFRYVTACERIDPKPMRCITVSSPSHLYLAGRAMVPTHNSDLIIGAATTQHRRSIIFRREYPQLKGIRDRMNEILRGRGSFNGQDQRYKIDNGHRIVELGAVQHEEDKHKHQGRPHDGVFLDELPSFTESQYRFLIGWTRSAIPGQRSRVIATGNPPTNAAGYWVIEYWAPWLDPRHPNPAKSGEIRWFATLKDKNGRAVDTEVSGPDPIFIPGEPDPVKPRSRAFIKALVQDNPFYMASGYISVLQAMPEPLRSQMLLGDFGAGQEDDERQVIPTAWVLAAQARWRPTPPGPIDSIGVDVARGGKDRSVYTPRHGTWFGEQVVYTGQATPDGWASLQQIVSMIPTGANPDINIDVIGVGSAVYDLAMGNGAGFALSAHAMDARHASKARDRSGKLGFVNKRAEWYWRFREALDPLLGEDLALPPDRELLADLTSPLWEARSNGILIESKDDIIDRLGRSPDKGDSIVLAYATNPPLRRTHII